jgi:hypothetical protein
MKIVLSIFLILLIFGSALPQNNPNGNSVLVLVHDTTVVTSQLKRLADKDTLQQTLSMILANYDLATIDSNSTLSNLSSYKSVILQETSFDAINCRYLGQAGRTALKAWLNSGTALDKKTLVSIGGDQAYNYSRSGSAARDLGLAQDLLMFSYWLDNGTVTGQYSIEGVGIDAGNVRTMTNSPVGSGFWPDAVQPLGGSLVLYKYSGRGSTDSVAAVGVNQTGYLGLSLFQDPRYFTNGSFQEVLLATLQYAVANGGTFPGLVPVELASFSASVAGTNVNLSWVTATELNNQGFDIERSTDQNQWEKIGFVDGKGTTTEMNYYSYSDKSLSVGTYYYRLKQLDFDGTSQYSDPVEAVVSVPMEFVLEQNYPNPFNPSTKIKFGLSVESKVTLKIFNILGQEVTTLFNGNLAAGEHEINFNAANMNSGVYLYQINAQGTDGKNFSSVKKMILSK